MAPQCQKKMAFSQKRRLLCAIFFECLFLWLGILLRCRKRKVSLVDAEFTDLGPIRSKSGRLLVPLYAELSHFLDQCGAAQPEQFCCVGDGSIGRRQRFTNQADLQIT